MYVSQIVVINIGYVTGSNQAITRFNDLPNLDLRYPYVTTFVKKVLYCTHIQSCNFDEV